MLQAILYSGIESNKAEPAIYIHACKLPVQPCFGLTFSVNHGHPVFQKKGNHTMSDVTHPYRSDILSDLTVEDFPDLQDILDDLVLNTVNEDATRSANESGYSDEPEPIYDDADENASRINNEGPEGQMKWLVANGFDAENLKSVVFSEQADILSKDITDDEDRKLQESISTNAAETAKLFKIHTPVMNIAWLLRNGFEEKDIMDQITRMTPIEPKGPAGVHRKFHDRADVLLRGIENRPKFRENLDILVTKTLKQNADLANTKNAKDKLVWLMQKGYSAREISENLKPSAAEVDPAP